MRGQSWPIGYRVELVTRTLRVQVSGPAVIVDGGSVPMGHHTWPHITSILIIIIKIHIFQIFGL